MVFSECLPAASVQLSIALLALNKQLTQSVAGVGCVCVSAPQLQLGACCRTGAMAALFLQPNSWAGWAQQLSPVHQACRNGRGTPFPWDLSLLGDSVAKPELARWRRNPTMAPAVPSLHFPSSLAAKRCKSWGSRCILRETATGPNASIPDPNPVRGWCPQCPLWPAWQPRRRCLAARPDRRGRLGSCRPTWPPLPRSPGWRRTGRCPGARCAG